MERDVFKTIQLLFYFNKYRVVEGDMCAQFQNVWANGWLLIAFNQTSSDKIHFSHIIIIFILNKSGKKNINHKSKVKENLIDFLTFIINSRLWRDKLGRNWF
jgi:hypothetical protein